VSRIAKSSIQEVFQRLDAITVVEEYVRLEKRGGRYWGRCPFHSGGQEKTPSFKVEPDQKLYYCFGCHKGGSIIDFVMEMDNLSFPEAIKTLARKFGIELIYEGGGEEDYEVEQSRREQLLELYRRTALSFSHFLLEKPEGRPALDYLLSRKISREMIERFRLGYSPSDRDWLYRFLQGKGYSPEFLDSSGLFSANYRGMAFFSGRLMFPIADRQGRVAAFGGRALPGAIQNDGKEPPKYINTREIDTYKKGQTLYALDLALPEIRRSKTVCLAEGYMDVIAMHQAGITNAVAPCGTAFTDEQARLLRHWADTAVLVFDSDDAGQKAVVKGIISCRKNGLACFVVVPDKAAGEVDLKDPADILEKFGPEVLNKSMKCVIIDLEYLVARGKTLFDVSTPQGKAGAFTVLYPYLEVLESSTEREACIETAADELRVDKDAVLSDYERWRKSGGNRDDPRASNGSDTGGAIRMNHELFSLIVVSINMDLYPEFRASIDMQEIEDPNARELFVALEESFRNEESSLEAVLSRIEKVTLRNFIIERSMSDEFRGDSKRDPRKLMEDGIRRITERKLRRRLSEIGAELRLREKNPDMGDFQELIQEKMDIDAKLGHFSMARNLEG
jgi:DNA primase